MPSSDSYASPSSRTSQLINSKCESVKSNQMGESEVIRAAFVARTGGLELRDVPRPRLEEGSIMVRMKASGVCGTDLEKLSGGYTESSILGHEVSGVVMESKTSAFDEGDIVVPHHHVACGECYFCKHGAETMCDGFRNSNFAPGGFADEFKVPQYNVKRGGVHKIGNLAHDEASFGEPLGCCLRGLNKTFKGDLKNVGNVLVVGAGPIGLLHMEILRSMAPDTKLVAVDLNSTRLDFAEREEKATVLDVRKSTDGLFSADALKQIDGRGYDLVIVATGSPAAFAESVRCVRKSGTLLLFGAPHKGSTYTLDLQSMLIKEITITGSYATTEKELDQALSLLEEGMVKVKKFVTSRFTLERIEEAMDAARSESQVKVLVTA